VEQIPNVAIICHEAPHLFGNVLRDYLLSIIMTYLNDSDNQVSDDGDLSAYSVSVQVLSFIILFLKQQRPWYHSGVNVMETCFCLGTTNGSGCFDDYTETGPS